MAFLCALVSFKFRLASVLWMLMRPLGVRLHVIRELFGEAVECLNPPMIPRAASRASVAGDRSWAVFWGLVLGGLFLRGGEVGPPLGSN
jgi:hypothetical protein